jgi:hypothetical protein
MAKGAKSSAKSAKTAKSAKVAECAVCHEVKPIFARGMCSADYFRFKRSAASKSVKLVEELTELEEGVDEIQAGIQAAKERLLKAVPDVVDDLLTASKVASRKGDARPAETILRELPVGPKDDDRILKPVSTQKGSHSAPVAQIQIVIPGQGQLGGWRSPQQLPAPVIDAE